MGFTWFWTLAASVDVWRMPMDQQYLFYVNRGKDDEICDIYVVLVGTIRLPNCLFWMTFWAMRFESEPSL